MPLPVSGPAEDLLTLTVVKDDRSARVTAAGEVDTCSAPRLAAALTAAISGGAREVTVDLDGVTFLGCSGVHALAAGHRRTTATAGRLRVVGARPAVRRALQISGLWPVLGAGHAA